VLLAKHAVFDAREAKLQQRQAKDSGPSLAHLSGRHSTATLPAQCECAISSEMSGAAQFVVAIDQGTSSTRVVVYDLQLRVTKTASRPLKARASRPGWLEMDGDDILASVDACLAEACEGLHGKIVCLGLTNQRETTIALDTATGLALSPAILWSDTRTVDICGEWKGNPERAAQVTAKTGLPISPYFSASKMVWLLRSNSSVQAAHKEGRLAFVTIDAFVLRHLTCGRLTTDGTNASRTMLMDLTGLRYDQEVISHLGLSGCAFADIVPSIGSFGVVRSGPLAGTPVSAVLGDQQAALLGQGCLAGGDCKATFGTGCFLLQHAGSARPSQEYVDVGLVATVAIQTSTCAATYALEGSVGAAGSVVTWLRDEMGFIGGYEQLDEEAAKVSNCGGVTVVPAFGGLLAPRWRSDARAAILGLSLSSTKQHIVRACLAGIAQSVADVVEVMGMAHGPLRVDGGLAESRVLMQLVADYTGREVWSRDDKEATALGIALAAGAGAHLWSLDEKTRSLESIWSRVIPQLPEEQRKNLRAEWKKIVIASVLCYLE
jgi:glycerol kinase